MLLFTIGHGRRPAFELVAALEENGIRTLVDVRRFPFSRRNPQFNQPALAAAVEASGIDYVHAEELGGLRSGDAGAERFTCLRPEAFRTYAARMGSETWQQALVAVLAKPVPALMCAETPWRRCHRRLISELLTARGHEIVHLLRPGESEPHRLYPPSDSHGGKLYLCGELVA